MALLPHVASTFITFGCHSALFGNLLEDLCTNAIRKQDTLPLIMQKSPSSLHIWELLICLAEYGKKVTLVLFFISHERGLRRGIPKELALHFYNMYWIESPSNFICFASNSLVGLLLEKLEVVNLILLAWFPDCESTRVVI